MKTIIPVLALSAIAVTGAAAERAVTKGANPVFSPEGSRIAFQRLEGDVFKVGVVAMPERRGEPSGRAKGGANPPGEPFIEWIESGPGNAAYPAWTPDGGLVYTAGNDAGTAYAEWKASSQRGYGLRLWKGGVKRDLTRGRCRDYTPCVSPDGTQVWFVTTRGVESESASFSQAAATRIAVIDIDRGESLLNAETQRRRDTQEAESPKNTKGITILLDAPNGSNSGYVQPVVSPDGSLLVWGQLDSFFDTWRIYGMRLAPDGAGFQPAEARVDTHPPGAWQKQADNSKVAARVTPSSLAALSPRWHPGGHLLCFTGFRAGDPAWGVWVENIRTGKVRRLATGENPCFSPDGSSIAYDRDGTIFVRPFGPDDEPDELLPDIRDDAEPESILWSASDIAAETVIDVAKDVRFAFGDDKTLFLRAKMRFGESGGVRQFLTAAYAEHPGAIQLYCANGEIHFASRDYAGKYFAARAPLAPRPHGDAHFLVAVRTPSRLVLSVDGAPPQEVFTGGALPLDTPQRLVVGTGLVEGDVLDSLEIGTGWPNELPKGPTREVLFQ